MKKTVVSSLTIGILLSGLYASGNHESGHESNNHMGDHMHNGKMMNHMNPDGMTSDKMKNMKAMHQTMMIDGYHVTISSKKPLTDGKNNISVMLKHGDKAVKNANISMKFSMPSMPGMEFTEHAGMHDNMYKTMVDFSMGGEWAYEMMIKTHDGKIHKSSGMVNVK